MKKHIGKLSFIIALVMIFTLMAPLSVFASYRYELLKKGDEDEYVLELQKALYDKKYLNVKPTGYFGTDTEAAVKAFQKDNDLRVDGIAGPETRKKLLGNNYKPIPEDRFRAGTINTAVTGTETGVSETPVLRQGDEGDTVKKVQKALRIYGYYSYEKITGYYGSITTAAVKQFQKNNGFIVNGSLTETELNLLLKGDPEFVTLRRGDEGDNVKTLQERLRKLGYFSNKATGYFGSATEEAVMKFQSANGISADGVVGKKTYTVLYSSEAVKCEIKTETKSKETEPKEQFIELTKEQLGKPYVYGDEGPDTFDCSGLVYFCLNGIGYKISRQSSKDYAVNSKWEDVEDKDDLKRGDLMFFRGSSSNSISHIAVYLGDGKLIHAIPSEGCVYISDFKGYWVTYYVSGKRVF